MKKEILSAIICAAAVLSLTACGKNEDPLGGLSNQNRSNSVSSTSNTPASTAAEQTSSKPEQSSVPESTPASSTVAQTSSASEHSSTPEATSEPNNNNEVDWDSVPYADELDFEFEDIDGGVQIFNYLGLDTIVKIPETIDEKKVIAVSTYYHTGAGLWSRFGDHEAVFNKIVTHVKLPDSVSNIRHAFNGCSSLVSVNIPNSLTTISDCAFYNCTALSSIEIPSTVTEIDHMSFQSSGLESITIPDSVKVFDAHMITYCANLKEVIIPKDICVANNIIDLFDCKSLTNTDFLKNVKPSDEDSNAPFTVDFAGCSSLTNITFPDGIQRVESFSGCENLTEITIPNSVIEVGFFGNGNLELDGCDNLKKITLPENLKLLKEESFSDCPKDLDIVYKGKTYKPHQAVHLCKAINGN